MTRLAWTSLRARPTSVGVRFLTVLLGATVVGAFATLLEAAAGDVPGADRRTLLTVGCVVGSWGLLIVLFSVASSTGLAIRARAAETAQLRAVGATAGQVRRMVLAESVAAGVVAALLAVLPARWAGGQVLRLLRNADMITATTPAPAGWLATGVTGIALVLVLVVAVGVATRPAALLPVRTAQARAGAGPRRAGRLRVVLGLLLLAAGAANAVLTLTVTVHASDPMLRMSTAGPAGVLSALGLATVSPVLLAAVARRLQGLLHRLGPAGRLAAADTRSRSHLLADVLAPVIVLVGIGVATLSMMAVHDEESGPAVGDGRSVMLLNGVVVAMISTFAAVMVLNTVAAAVADRRQEFARQRLAGATRGQVVAVMAIEGGVIAIAGVLWGAVASLATVLPYTWVTAHRLLSTAGAGRCAGLVAAAVVLVVLGSAVATRRALAAGPLATMTS